MVHIMYIFHLIKHDISYNSVPLVFDFSHLCPLAFLVLMFDTFIPSSSATGLPSSTAILAVCSISPIKNPHTCMSKKSQ